MIPLTVHTASLAQLNPSTAAPTALPDRIYAVLKYRILTCSMLPGQRITEKAICAELSVSRTPLREALNRLALEGLVVITPYRGYAVTTVTVASFRELCQLRRIIEPGTAGIAAQMVTSEDVARLRAVAELTYTPGDRETYEAYLRANSVFHHELVRCTHNRLLETVVMSALDRHQRPLYLGLDVGLDASAATAEHYQILAAVEAHDSERAHELMVQHIAGAEQRIVSALRAAGY